MVIIGEEFSEKAMDIKFRALRSEFAAIMAKRETIIGDDPKAIADAAEKMGDMTDKMTEADQKGTFDRIASLFQKWMEMGGALEPFLAFFELVMAMHKSKMADVVKRLWEIMFSPEAVRTADALAEAMSRMNDWMRLALQLEIQHEGNLKNQAKALRDLTEWHHKAREEYKRNEEALGGVIRRVDTLTSAVDMFGSKVNRLITTLNTLRIGGGGGGGPRVPPQGAGRRPHAVGGGGSPRGGVLQADPHVEPGANGGAPLLQPSGLEAHALRLLAGSLAVKPAAVGCGVLYMRAKTR